MPTDLVSDLEDAHEVDSIENDEEYWKTSWNIDDSSAPEEEEAITLNTRSDKTCYGLSKYGKDHKWLYFSQ